MAKHLTLEERDRIAHLRSRGFSQAAIGEMLTRDPSVISRELRRNSSDEGPYYAATAHHKSGQRRKDRPLERKMDRPQIRSAVQRGLHKDWSPDQIRGWQRRHFPTDPTQWVSATTIYTWIRQDEHQAMWKAHLRRRGKAAVRRKTPPRPENQRISSRPEIIEQRGRQGDLEGDTVLGPPGTGGIITMVDRATRLLTMAKIESKNADHVAQRLKRRLKKTPHQPVRSMTFDNGTEFASCHKVAKTLRARLFFARPGCPYQRGTNENTNGLIRQYFPKGTPLNTVTGHQVRRVERLINNRPRRCLDYMTPLEASAKQQPSPPCLSDS